MSIKMDNENESKNSEITTSVPIHQQLGSVLISANDGSDKSPQIRSSARVVKKMRIDLTTSLVTEKKEKKEEKPYNKKHYRPLWTSEDKTLFFEALNEYGKDFESIHLYISNKLKKRGFSDQTIKSKDQVRHLYYRNWNKISKYVKFDEGIKKVVQELYALINYGEIKKKVGSVTEKSYMKLNELIYTGTLALRHKGKTVRIKTPMCRALRRLNQLDEKYDEIKLPTRVTVELRPKDMSSYLKVQSIAQNPRLRTVVLLQKRLNTIISCVSKKWRTADSLAYDKALVVPPLVALSSDAPIVKNEEENKLLLTPLLRLSPPCDAKIELPSINLSEYFTRQSICLQAYMNRIGMKPSEDELPYICKPFKSNQKKGFRLRTDSISDKPEKSPLKAEVHTDDNDSSKNESIIKQVDEVTDDAVNTILSLQRSSSQEAEEIKTEETAIEKTEELPNIQRIAQIQNIKKGWTVRDDTITVGEIYLMFGSDSKLILEYSWDEQLPHKPKIENFENDETLMSGNQNPLEMKRFDFTISLSKLLSVAKLHYKKNAIKCPCGHVCGQQKNLRVKRAADPKISRINTNVDKDSDNEEQEVQWVKPNYLNIRGRNSKRVVVERRLPLLLNKVRSGHQIVRMNIISQSDIKELTIPQKKDPQTSVKNLELAPSSDTANIEGNILKPTEDKADLISDLLSVDHSNGLDSDVTDPTIILQESDNWINSEVADYSLSSLLGHLESPSKISRTGTPVEDSRLSQDVDVHLQSLLNESSVDFSAKFADLAAQVVIETKKN